MSLITITPVAKKLPRIFTMQLVVSFLETKEEVEYMKKSSLIGLLTLLFLSYFFWLHASRRTTINGGERIVSKRPKRPGSDLHIEHS